MTRFCYVLAVLSYLWPLALAGQPPAKIDVRFPPPTLAAPQSGNAKLTPEQWFVVDSDVPIIVTASPLGLVSITEETGPIKVRGLFVGGTGKTETRTFGGKSVYFIEAVASGTCEILAIPLTAKSAADIVRRSIDVNVGPRPPPIDPVDPPTPAKTDKLSIVVIWESADSTPAIAAVMKDLVFWRSLEALGVKWFQIDKDQKNKEGAKIIESNGYQTFIDRHGLPTIIYIDQKTNSVIQSGKLPATKQAIQDAIKALTGS